MSLVVAGLAVAGLPALPASATASTTSEDLAALMALAPGVPVTAPNSAGVSVLSGAVKTTSGRPVSAGVPVFMFAAPSLASMSTQQVGQSIQYPLVAATLTDASGAYSFPQAGVVAKLTQMNSAYQQIVVPTLTEAGTQTVNLLQADPVMQDGTVDGGLMAVPADAGAPNADTSVTAADLATHDGNVTVPDTAAPATQIKAATAGTQSDKAAVSVLPYDVAITRVTLLNAWPQNVGIGWLASKSSGAWAQFTYSTGASSTLGIGVSASGSLGSYSQSGTVNVSSGATLTWPKIVGKGSEYYSTDFEYGKYLTEYFVGATRTGYQYSVRPTGRFAGGGYVNKNVVYPTTQSASYCRQYLAGFNVTKNTTDALTWSNGVAIGNSYANVNLSAKTGYTSAVTVTVYRTTAGYICGVNSYAADNVKAPGVIYASDTTS